MCGETETHRRSVFVLQGWSFWPDGLVACPFCRVQALPLVRLQRVARDMRARAKAQRELARRSVERPLPFSA